MRVSSNIARLYSQPIPGSSRSHTHLGPLSKGAFSRPQIIDHCRFQLTPRDGHNMQYTPVIPPAPGSQSPSSRQRPPAIPTLSPTNPPAMPPWATPQQFPFMGPHMMGSAPGSYFIPPVALPPQQAPNSPHAPVNSGGFSHDWTGFPNSASAATSPYVAAASPPQSAHSPGFPPHSAPATGYNAFQQPLPGYGGIPPNMPPGMHPAMWPMMGMGMGVPMTPYMMPPPGWGGTPYMPPGAGLPPQAAPAAAPPPAPAAQPRVPPMYANQFDKVDKFAEGPHCK